MPIDSAGRRPASGAGGGAGNGAGGTVDPEFAFLTEPDTSGELVAVHCEATSYDLAKADLRTVAAIRIRGPRILTSGRLVLPFWPTEPAEPGIARLLHHIGARPIVGYYLDFTMALLNRLVRPMIGIDLPNRRIEVSGLYYDRKLRTASKSAIDLKLDSILAELDLPPRSGEDAPATALAAALVYRRLIPAEPMPAGPAAAG